MKYDYKAVEAKWQKVWEDEKTFHAEIDHTKPKFYALVEFPYPSGAGLHVLVRAAGAAEAAQRAVQTGNGMINGIRHYHPA